MADIPENAPEHCPGPESEEAGKASACDGCPNQSICASGAQGGPDPDLPIIQQRMQDITNKILILSGKGGVGKSTFTGQLSYAFASNPDYQVGVMDIDICGPSIPKLMHAEGEPIHQSASGWSPVYVEDNLAVMSVGFLLPNPDEAVVWRGARKNGLIKQFLKDVNWGELDYLFVDTPPGTTDEHLSIAKFMNEVGIDGAIIITTPQEVSISDVRKEINFCRKSKIPVIGVVENMSGFVCPSCHGESVIFPPTTGGAKQLCLDMKIPLLGRVPLDPRIGQCCDHGKSFLELYPDSKTTEAFKGIIENINNYLASKSQIQQMDEDKM